MALNPKYVFGALVKDKNQPLELMAYAIYKADKNEIAESLANLGKSQTEIDAALQHYHDSVLNSPGILTNYGNRARQIGDDLIFELLDETRAKARKDFVERVMQTVKKDETIATKIGNFALDAVKGVASTLFVIVLFGGVYSLFLSKDERSKYFEAVGQSVTDAATGEIPVVDKYREISKSKPPAPQPALLPPQLPSTQPVPANPRNSPLPPNFQPPAANGQPGMVLPNTAPTALPPLPENAPAK